MYHETKRPRVTACAGKRVSRLGLRQMGACFQRSGNEKKPARVENSPYLRLSAAKRLCISPLPCVLSSHNRDHPDDQWPPNCLSE